MPPRREFPMTRGNSIRSMCFLAILVVSCAPPSSVENKPSGVEPVTLSVLRLMPESAGVALGIPPMSGFRGELAVIARNLAGALDGSENTLAKWFTDFAETSQKDEGAVTAWMDERGLDANAPIGVFFGPVPPVSPENPVENARLLPSAIVFGLSDAAKARDAIITDLKAIGKWETIAFEESSHGKTPVFWFDEAKFVYAILGDRLLLSNTTEFAGELIDRAADPASIRYGTAECPAKFPNEFAALIRMDSAAGALRPLVGGFAGAQGAATLLGQQLAAIPDAFDSDPLVITAAKQDDRFELLGRLDLMKHERVRKAFGKPEPLRLARVLPDNTLGFFSIRFSEASKGLMNAAAETLFKPKEDVESLNFMGQSILGEWLRFVDDEATIAVTGYQGDVPTVLGMLAIDNTQNAATVLALLPGVPLESFRNVDLRRAVLGGFKLYYAVARNVLTVGTDQEDVKGALTRLLDDQDSGFLGSFDPPLDADFPRYGGLWVTSDAIDALGLRKALSEGDQVLAKLAAPVREVRISTGVDGAWFESRLEVFLNPPEAPAIPE